jgi:energy-coupling factor transport system substrate-specific component
MAKQKLVLKQKKKKGIVSTPAQRLAIRSLQKQLQLLRLKEILVLIGFTVGAALLRIPMQAVPSAEPLTFFAILAGWLFGRSKGFAVGASSLWISNFFMFGGQGPWTPFQALGFGIAGFFGGFLRKNASIFEILLVTLTATLAFEIIMNSFTPLMLGGAGIFLAFFLALPFTLVHLVSNFIFAFGLKPAKKFIEKTGGFDEKDICNAVLAKFNIGSKSCAGWLSKLGREKNREHRDCQDNS